MTDYKYSNGFNNIFISEFLEGSVPSNNSPQKCKNDLYAEQLSGTPFVCPRFQNKRSWLYRLKTIC